MYSPQITRNQLEVASRSLTFELEYHSVAHCDSNVKHLNSLINLDRWRERREIEFTDPVCQQRFHEGKPLLECLEPDESQWVQNEKTLCTFDYLYLATRYAYITDSLGKGLVHYSPNIAQLILNDIRAEMEELYVAICLFQLKGRQAGITTDNQIVLLQRVLFWLDTHIITASSDPDKTSKVHSKMELALEHMPWWTFPRGWDQRKTGEHRINGGEMRTSVTLQHGTQESGISRGDTITCGHLTELEDFLHPDEDVDNSLIKAMHFNPETYFCMEFTAKWTESYMHRKWKRAEEYYPQGKYRFRPFFLPWFISSDIYPTPTEIRQFFNPIRATWKPQPITIAQALRAQESVAKNPFYHKYLGRDWKMPVEQMWFWEWDRDQAKADGRLGPWISEMPGSSAEAWQVPGNSIFDTELIHDLRNSAKQPLAAFDIGGEGITPRMRAQGIRHDMTLPPIPVTYQTEKHQAQYMLNPILVDDWETFNPNGKLIVYELPLEDDEYYFSLDASQGVEQDSTVCDVLRKGDGVKPDEQVAQFASNLISGEDFDPIALCIGQFYTVVWNGGQETKQPQFIPELAKGGKTCMNNMRMKGWRNIYVHVPLSNKVQDASKVATLGWPSNQVTRDEVVGEFIKAARERGEFQYLQINSRWTINEMATFGINPRKRKLEALGGAHDDRIFGIALPHWAANIFQLRGRGETPWERRRRQSERQEAQIIEYSYGPMAQLPQIRLNALRRLDGSAYARQQLLHDYEAEELVDSFEPED